MTLTHLSDEELLTSLHSVEDRRLDLRSACSSLFDFCLKRLGMSESEAVRRIDAARLVKRFPCLLEHIERGDLQLTSLLLLRDHFTTDNVIELARAARGKTKREIQELIVSMAPKREVPPTITPLPTLLPAMAAEPSPPARIEPLAPSRHRLELTVSDAVRAKLERARDLLGHRIPSGDLEAVLDEALDALLTKLEKERPGDGIPRSVRREVFARDGEACAYTDPDGARCGSRVRLELDHVVPRARGGSDEAANLRVVCRAHNQLLAEEAFGREHVQQQVYLRQRRHDDRLDVAQRALTKMGFRATDVRRKLREVFPPETLVPPLPELLRVALTAMVS